MAHIGLTLTLLLFPGCNATPQEKSQPAPAVLRVAAASDLQGVLPELAGAFTASTGVAVNTVIGASGQLAEQIRQGAPYDVFLSANISYVRDLAKAGQIETGSVQVYAQGRLVLVVSTTSNVGVEQLADLTHADIKRIAIANPKFAPYGLAARQALEKSDLWKILEPKIVQAESVRQALQFVESGNAEVGLVAHSVAQVSDLRSIDVDPTLYEPILQGLGISSASEHQKEARQFTDFLVGDEGRKRLGAHGFGLPVPNAIK